MSRWKVAQHVQYRFWLAYPAVYDSEQPESNMDDDLPRQPLACGFRKWQDAMAYADRMARTREVVLPRHINFPTLRHHVNRAGVVMEWEQSTRFPNLPPKYLTVHPDELRPLALALLALAEQEESCER